MFLKAVGGLAAAAQAGRRSRHRRYPSSQCGTPVRSRFCRRSRTWSPAHPTIFCAISVWRPMAWKVPMQPLSVSVSSSAPDGGNPTPETLFEDRGIRYLEQPAEGVVRRCAMRQHRISPQPRFVVIGQFRHTHPGFRAAQHSAQCHDHYLAQVVPLRRSGARGCRPREGLVLCHSQSRQESSVHLNLLGAASPCHNCRSVNGIFLLFKTFAYPIALHLLRRGAPVSICMFGLSQFPTARRYYSVSQGVVDLYPNTWFDPMRQVLQSGG